MLQNGYNKIIILLFVCINRGDIIIYSNLKRKKKEVSLLK